MKIAVITDDGTTISQHFGRAQYYMVCTVEDGKIVAREMRDKMGHQHFTSEAHDDPPDPRGHGFSPSSQDKHAQMATAIADCDVLIVRGMGRGAYVSMEQANIKPIVTELPTVDAAVQAYIDGTIQDHTERLH